MTINRTIDQRSYDEWQASAVSDATVLLGSFDWSCGSDGCLPLEVPETLRAEAHWTCWPVPVRTTSSLVDPVSSAATINPLPLNFRRLAGRPGSIASLTRTRVDGLPKAEMEADVT